MTPTESADVASKRTSLITTNTLAGTRATVTAFDCKKTTQSVDNALDKGSHSKF